MTVFDTKRRDLQALVEFVRKDKNKGAQRTKDFVSPNIGVEDFAFKRDGDNKGKEAQELALKKAETAKKRETR